MFNKPIFETLPIALIAIGFLTILMLHNVVALIEGVLLILAASLMVIVRLVRLGTDTDALDDMHKAK